MTEQEIRDEPMQAVAEPEEVQSAAPEQDEVSKLKQEKQELFERLARMQAEFDNFSKRSKREQEEFRHYAIAEAVKIFLQVLDNFNLTLKSATSSADDLRTGAQLT